MTEQIAGMILKLILFFGLVYTAGRCFAQARKIKEIRHAKQTSSSNETVKERE